MFSNWFNHKPASTKSEVSRTEESEHGELEEVEEDADEDDELEDDEYDEETDQDAIEQVDDWREEWSKTPAFEALTEEQRDKSEAIIEHFTRYMYDVHDVLPDEWTVVAMEKCCLESLPRKVTAEDAYFRSVAPVLGSFFRFLDRTVRLRNASKMADRVHSIDRRILSASQDPRNWGMAKSIAMSVLEAGVDPTNQKEMNAFLALYNARIATTQVGAEARFAPDVWSTIDDLEPAPMPYERSGPKVGRNDPCSCGSGRKYKKCCGGV